MMFLPIENLFPGKSMLGSTAAVHFIYSQPAHHPTKPTFLNLNYSRMARNRNHRVDEAKDGRDAVEKVKAAIDENAPYDTILIDYEMPVLKGPDAVLEIRRMGCDSLIVGITGNVLEEDINHFISCGANSVLGKPVIFQKVEDIWAEHGILDVDGGVTNPNPIF